MMEHYSYYVVLYAFYKNGEKTLISTEVVMNSPIRLFSDIVYLRELVEDKLGLSKSIILNWMPIEYTDN